MPTFVSTEPPEAPAGGTVVTVNGANFGSSSSDLSAVLFGAEYVLAMTFVNSNRLVVVAPPAAAAATVNVTVRSLSHGNGTAQSFYTYNAGTSLL